jgi:lipopolysaccharide export system permease protein
MPSLLFIAPTDLGEAVLATGALDYASTRLGGAATTIVCPPDARDLYRATPGLEALFAEDSVAPWLSLARRSFSNPFDACIDLAGTAAVHAISVRHRSVRTPSRVVRHLVEDWAELLGADRGLAPKLSLDDRARARAAAILPEAAPLLVLAPGGMNAAKRWSPEGFAAAARRLVGNPLSDALVVVLGAASRDGALSSSIAASLEADGVGARDLQGLDLLAAAALMERATLCLGNDNALTHIAAAMGAPTLTLFGPTDERMRAPYGPRARTLRGQSFEEAAAAARLDARAGMAHLSIDAVESAARELLHAGGLR